MKPSELRDALTLPQTVIGSRVRGDPVITADGETAAAVSSGGDGGSNVGGAQGNSRKYQGGNWRVTDGSRPSRAHQNLSLYLASSSRISPARSKLTPDREG